ncbi:unnamed protein product, partial [Cyprideis torosa]
MLDAERILNRTKATLVAAYEVTNWYAEKGIENRFAVNHGGTFSQNGVGIKSVNAIHSSSFPDGVYGGNPMGFLIHTDKQACYVAGDTALHMDMKLIPEFVPKLDLAILPIGDVFTMGVKDAAIAAEYVQCDRVLGCHYDTFPPIA